MKYKINNIENPTDIIERQAETIRKLQQRNIKKTKALIKASKEIAKLKDEKKHVTQTLNKISRQVNLRFDQNWDSRPKEESWEL